MPKSMSLSDLAKNSKSVAPPQHKPMQDVVMEGDDIEDNVMKEPPKEIKASDKVSLRVVRGRVMITLRQDLVGGRLL